MFISVLELFKIGVGPSSSHTMGPMIAANQFAQKIEEFLGASSLLNTLSVRCILRGSLAYTGKGHATDLAVTLGLNGYEPKALVNEDVRALKQKLDNSQTLRLSELGIVKFKAERDIVFDQGKPLPEHPNGMVFNLLNEDSDVVLSETYFSIGGGFVDTLAEIRQLTTPLSLQAFTPPYAFDSADAMLRMSSNHQLSIAQMKRCNETARLPEAELNAGLETIWDAMRLCVENGLGNEGLLPGGLKISRRAKYLHDQLIGSPDEATMNDWLCAYAMAVNEENAAGCMVVTAPTNGAAGVIPAVLYYVLQHENVAQRQIPEFLLVAGAIGGIIKHRSSISGAELGCQGEVGSAAAMAAAGLCAIRGGTSAQIENAAEIALEHHLGMTCDPVAGLVQVPCIERNGFGAIKAYAAASLALRGTGQHFMPLDKCIAAMKQTGLEMSVKYKETSLGGLAVSITEC